MAGPVRRIMHVITTADIGGAEIALLRLLERNDPSRHSVSVVSLKPPESLGEAYGRLAPLHSLEMHSTLPTPATFMRLRDIFRRERPDLVQAWMYHGNLVATAGALLSGFRGPVLWNIRHSLHAMRYEKRSSRVVIRANAALSRLPRAIIYNAAVSMKQHEAIGFAKDRGVLIPNGFDGDVFRPRPEIRDEMRAELSLPPDAPVVGMVARYHPMKDPENLFNAFARVRQAMGDARLVLAGQYTDEERDWTMGDARALGLEGAVSLIGRRPDVPRVLAAFDVVASPSAWGEGFPNAIGEAMASGIPCVATDVGDSAAVVSRHGWVVPPRAPDALAQALLEVLSLSPEERRRLGEDARRHILRNYEIGAVADRYAELHDQFLDRAAGCEKGLNP